MTAAAAEPARAAQPAGARVVSPWNPANAVTASRFLTLPALWWAVDNDHHQWATLFILVCGLLDKVDGLVARIFDCRSAFGELFDAITDGLCYGFGLILVAAYGWAPAVPVGFVIGLGLINTGLRFVYIRRAGRPVNYKSYAMERIVAYTGYLIGFATSGMEVSLFYWAFVPIMLVIVLHDAKRMLLDPIPAPVPAPIPAPAPVPAVAAADPPQAPPPASPAPAQPQRGARPAGQGVEMTAGARR